MKRILINATQNEEIRVALCKGNHLYDFDLENRTREQKKSNIYKGHVTRVEPSLEAVFVEYGSQRQGFLPIREISSEYLKGNPRDENIKKLIKEGDELIVQVEKEERGNKGAALSTYVSLAGRYLVLMPNNPRGGGISRQISGKLREDMKRMLSNLDLPKAMSVIIRTAGIGKTQEDLQHDLNHLLNIWQAIQEQNKKYPSPRLVHQEAGVVTRAVRDYLRDDIAEIWIDNENAYIEAAGFIDAVMPKQAEKLRKYTDYEPMFSRFNIEKQIETAYQREVRLPSGGSIVIDQTEALVSIDINSAKSTKGSDVAETAFHTNLEAADEIARQLRLRDMGGLIVIDFIDMNDNKNQKEVEKRLVDATKYDRARVQFGDISKFGLMEMSRQRLRPSLEESTGYICPRCHGNGMIRDLRSLSLSIMRQIEQIALKERQGEVQAEVPTDIAAFLLNEKRDSLVYLEQDSGTRITILPHAHLESPNFKLHFNRDGFAPSSYERITDTQQQEHSDLGYEVDWQTAESDRPEQQPTRQPRVAVDAISAVKPASRPAKRSGNPSSNNTPAIKPEVAHSNERRNSANHAASASSDTAAAAPQAIAWLSNLFKQAPQAQPANSVSSHEAAQAIEALVNTGAQSLGAIGQVNPQALNQANQAADDTAGAATSSAEQRTHADSDNDGNDSSDDKRRRKGRKSRSSKSRHKKDGRDERQQSHDDTGSKAHRQSDETRDNQRSSQDDDESQKPTRHKRKSHSQRDSRGSLERGETLSADRSDQDAAHQGTDKKTASRKQKSASNPNEVTLQVNESPVTLKTPEVVHLSLDDSKPQREDKPKSASKSRQTRASDASASDNTAQDIADVATVTAKTSSDADNKQATASAPASDETVSAEESVVSDEDQAATDQSAKASPVSAEPSDDDSRRGSGYDHQTLFKDRYVTATQFGQASNDPRVVRAQQRPARPQVDTSTSADAVPSIHGSVGEFISKLLPDAKARMASEGVIACFIEAMAVHQQQSAAAANNTTANTTANTAATASDAHADAEFDFSNYGYEALDDDYLARFKAMTQAVGQFNVAQGKTAAAPAPVGKRASNDPRGPHPDYQGDDRADDQSSSAAPEPAADTVSATALSTPSQADQVTEDSEQLLSERTGSESLDDQDSAGTDDQDDHSSAASVENDADPDNMAETEGADEQSSKTKTTIASYKNMIENVAEQLLPQTGMFNLTTPRVPKSRSRKPKTEHKKPTQIEQADMAQRNDTPAADNDSSDKG